MIMDYLENSLYGLPKIHGCVNLKTVRVIM